ncbi:hypothetical protein TIFTF001_010178 [Ficus carica]|uniref:Uncharacterized protein n=1 Tax=Ficus carica TaxID=3494 RepID=A0AA88D495_FICCA|nr:hypothetical protein TIFTF001_010178 [Ficus carica]
MYSNPRDPTQTGGRQRLVQLGVERVAENDWVKYRYTRDPVETHTWDSAILRGARRVRRVKHTRDQDGRKAYRTAIRAPGRAWVAAHMAEE